MVSALRAPVMAVDELRKCNRKGSKRIDMLFLFEEVEQGEEAGSCLCRTHQALYTQAAPVCICS